MPRRSTISTLPIGIRRQLDAKLIASNYGSVAQVAAWLTRKGYPIGKSAVGAYTLKARRRAEAAQNADQEPATIAPGLTNLVARLGCLCVAAATGPAATLLPRASRYLKWVQQVDSKGPEK